MYDPEPEIYPDRFIIDSAGHIMVATPERSRSLEGLVWRICPDMYYSLDSRGSFFALCHFHVSWCVLYLGSEEEITPPDGKASGFIRLALTYQPGSRYDLVSPQRISKYHIYIVYKCLGLCKVNCYKATSVYHAEVSAIIIISPYYHHHHTDNTF
jgi:hypothetical protein